METGRAVHKHELRRNITLITAVNVCDRLNTTSALSANTKNMLMRQFVFHIHLRLFASDEEDGGEEVMVHCTAHTLQPWNQI